MGRRKNIGLIPVQATARSRRLYKMRGRRPALQGRPRLGSRLAVQLLVEDDGDGDAGIVRHKLPGKQTQKKGAGHSLSSSVLANKRCAKKH